MRGNQMWGKVKVAYRGEEELVALIESSKLEPSGLHHRGDLHSPVDPLCANNLCRIKKITGWQSSHPTPIKWHKQFATAIAFLGSICILLPLPPWQLFPRKEMNIFLGNPVSSLIASLNFLRSSSLLSESPKYINRESAVSQSGRWSNHNFKNVTTEKAA